MTPEAINRAIAEWCGWTKITLRDIGIGGPVLSGLNPSGNIRAVPNYYGDLNACRGVELMLSKDQRVVYSLTMSDLWGESGDFGFCAITASPPQRCEALLRTLNLWKEETK